MLGRRRTLRLTAWFLAASLSAGCSDDPNLTIAKPDMKVTPTTVEFGQVQIGTQATIPLKIENTGEGFLIVNIASAAGGDEQFSFECTGGTCDRQIIGAGASGVVNVRFSPTSSAAYSSSLTLTPGTSEITPVQVPVSGNGIDIVLQVEPESVNFGRVVVQSTKTLDVTVTNPAMIPADVHYSAGTNVTFCGGARSNTAEFCVAPTDKPFSADSRFALAPGGSTKLSVQYTPSGANGLVSGRFSLKGCAACPDVSVGLGGSGVETGFQCMPDEIDWGAVNPSSCVSRKVTCTNGANETVTIVDHGFDDQTPNSTDFVIPPFAGLVSIDQGETFELDVQYCPTNLGPDTGRLQIETDNTDEARRFVRIPLTGNGGGPDIDVAPLTLNFGEVAVGAPSRRSLLVSNVGFAELEVQSFSITQGGNRAFSTSSAGQVIPVGGSHVLTVTLSAEDVGDLEGDLIIRSNDADEPVVRVRLVGRAIRLPTCQYEVSPSRLEFGVVERGRTLGRAFEIRNTGQADCIVTSARILSRSDRAFSLPQSNLRSLRIAPGSSRAIRAIFAPETPGTATGVVEFSISSINTPFNEVALTGTGADGGLLIVPRELEFGTIPVPCAARPREVTIYNTSASPATIDALQIEPPGSAAFVLQNVPAPLPSAPLSLDPGASTRFQVLFSTTAVSEYASAVEIQATYLGQSVRYIVSLQGRGDNNANQVDEFSQLGQPKVDILMVVDDSCSMSQEQANIAQNFTTFIQFADSQMLDYNIAVTTTDVGPNGPQGAFVGSDPVSRIVRPQTQPSPQAQFATNVNVGTDGSQDEQGLHAAFLALSNPLIFGHNSGFLRPDAVLSLIFISDEPDASQASIDFYVNFFFSIKGFRNTNLFTASAIVGDLPSGCTGDGGAAGAGPRYIGLSNRTGGIFQSICTDNWSRSLEALSSTAFGFKSRFFLSNQPVRSTLQVIVDGSQVPDRSSEGALNWDYDAATNAVNFSPIATPEPGAQIRMEYTVACL